MAPEPLVAAGPAQVATREASMVDDCCRVQGFPENKKDCIAFKDSLETRTDISLRIQMRACHDGQSGSGGM